MPNYGVIGSDSRIFTVLVAEDLETAQSFFPGYVVHPEPLPVEPNSPGVGWHFDGEKFIAPWDMPAENIDSTDTIAVEGGDTTASE